MFLKTSIFKEKKRFVNMLKRCFIRQPTSDITNSLTIIYYNTIDPLVMYSEVQTQKFKQFQTDGYSNNFAIGSNNVKILLQILPNSRHYEVVESFSFLIKFKGAFNNISRLYCSDT